MGAEIEKVNGIPAVVIIGPPFRGLVKTAVRAKGLAPIALTTLPQAVLTHEIEDFMPYVGELTKDIIYALTKWQPAEEKVAERKPFRFEGKDYQEAVDRMNMSFMAQGMGDGLPLVPPTKERVEWMLTGVDLPPGEVIARLQDLYRPVTVMNIAINAAMAGARPEYMPVLIATFKALAKSGQQHYLFSSTGSTAPVAIVNGPIAKELNINSGVGLMGPGWQANATIGRAIGLILTNGVGQKPGTEGISIQSLPGRYTWCFAESEEANPWQPLHVELGYSPEVSVVSVLAGRGTQPIMVDPPAARVLAAISDEIEGLRTFWYAMKYDQLLVLSPMHSQVLAKEGWKKEDIKRYIYENSRIPYSKAQAAGLGLKDGEQWQAAADTSMDVPMIRGPEYVVIVVAGGAGSHNSTLIPCIQTRSSEEIDKYQPRKWRELLSQAKLESGQ